MSLIAKFVSEERFYRTWVKFELIIIQEQASLITLIYKKKYAKILWHKFKSSSLPFSLSIFILLINCVWRKQSNYTH